jgi:hypothetical protein
MTANPLGKALGRDPQYRYRLYCSATAFGHLCIARKSFIDYFGGTVWREFSG